MNQMTAVDIWFMCGRKRAFEKERTARKWARSIDGRRYRCPICDKWHITKKK